VLRNNNNDPANRNYDAPSDSNNNNNNNNDNDNGVRLASTFLSRINIFTEILRASEQFSLISCSEIAVPDKQKKSPFRPVGLVPKDGKVFLFTKIPLDKLFAALYTPRNF
jgi:hypothetical protein